MPQVGRVIIQDDVEIGANSSSIAALLRIRSLGKGPKLIILFRSGTTW